MSLCIVSHRACHKETQWLTSLVLEKMWPVPAQDRVNCEVELRYLKNSREHRNFTVSSFCLASHNHCLYIMRKRKKKSDSYHMPSDFLMWQPICVLIPSFCGSESKTWQFSLEQHMAYDIVYLNRSHSIRNTGMPNIINKKYFNNYLLRIQNSPCSRHSS